MDPRPLSRPICLLLVAALLSACAGLGGPGLNLSLREIADRAFFDRQGMLGQVLRAVDVDVSRPDVAVMPDTQRLELGWTVSIRAPTSLSMRIGVSGRPEINAQRTGIDLADARLEELRLPSVPLVNLAHRLKVGDSLGRLPLLTFTPQELRRADTLYQATGVILSSHGVRVDLAPR